MFRDHHPVQAARAMAVRHDTGQAGGRAGPRRQGARSVQRGCRPSATASTCWPPASRARWASRSPAPTWPRWTATTSIESVVKTVPGVSACRAAHRRALHRCRRGPAGGSSIRPGRGRRPSHHLFGHRRRQRRRGDQRARALPHQLCATRVSCATRWRASSAALRDAGRRDGAAAGCGPRQCRRRPAHGPEARTRACRAGSYVDVRGRDLALCRAGHAASCGSAGCDADRLAAVSWSGSSSTWSAPPSGSNSSCR